MFGVPQHVIPHCFENNGHDGKTRGNNCMMDMSGDARVLSRVETGMKM